MPIHVRWKDDSKTILVFAYEGKWDLEDFYESSSFGNEFLDEVHHPVTMVLDVAGSKMIPNGFIGALKNVYREVHPNAGIVVMVGINVFARSFIHLFRKLYPEKDKVKPIYFAADYDEVRQLAAEHQQTAMHSTIGA